MDTKLNKIERDREEKLNKLKEGGLTTLMILIK